MENAILREVQPVPCKHCGEPVDSGTQPRSGAFCCAGCRAVYSLLHDQGLSDFYRYAATNSIERPREVSKWEYLDDPNFQAHYSSGPGRMKFFVPGLDCTACVWLIDQIPSHSKTIDAIQTDFFSSTVEVTVSKNSLFSEAAKTLQDYGLNPSPVQSSQERFELLKAESRRELTRIAVAALATGNIMLLAISIYAGAEGLLKTVFEWLMFALAVPVFTYSALPFYKNSFNSLKHKKIHLDLPISLAIWAGMAVSLYHLSFGGSELYFDSLSMLVFLLLGSRYLLKTLQGRHVGRLPISNYLYAVSARDKDGKLVSSLSLRAGDSFQLRSLDQVPADGLVVQGLGWIDNSSLTGESQTQRVGPGDDVFAGTTLVEGELLCTTTQPVQNSRVSKLLEAVETDISIENTMGRRVDRLAQVFLYAILSVSLATVIYFALNGETSEGLYRALTVMIVTCPCVFAMAIPWTNNLAVRAAAKKGVLVKNSQIFERLIHAQELIFDKTGTLTQGFLEVQNFKILDSKYTGEQLLALALELESGSSHPVAKAICRYINKLATVEAVKLTDIQALPTGGINARHENALWTIAPCSNKNELTIGVFKNKELLATFTLADLPRADSAQALNELRPKYKNLIMLSGDQTEVANKIAKELQIDTVQALQTPESKMNFVKLHPLSIMIGDGNNDAPALSASYGSIAVQGSLEASLKAADVYLTRPGLIPVVDLLNLSKHTMRVIRDNLTFTVFYNLVGLSLALTGQITALWAAVLMPMSSLTVTLHSLYRMRKQ